MNKIKFILHIGMGKTGTTSIQSALENNKGELAKDGVVYLGQWFDMIDPALSGLAGANLLFAAPPEERARYGEKFLEYLLQRHRGAKAHTFILSSEGLLSAALTPFLTPLMESERLDLRVLAYARNPPLWLESAYFQWGVRHKTNPGRFRPFRVVVKLLVRHYKTLVLLHQELGETLVVRHYDEIRDVVADFFAQCGVKRTFAPVRKYGRDDLAELLLRKEYNHINPAPKHPNAFDMAFWGGWRTEPVESVEDIVRSFYDTEAMKEAIAEEQDSFAYLKDQLGLDLDLAVREPEPVADDRLRERLIDYLVATVVRLVDRVDKLEKQAQPPAEPKS